MTLMLREPRKASKPRPAAPASPVPQTPEEARAERSNHSASSDSAAVLLSRSVARISDGELLNMSREDLIDVARMVTWSLPQKQILKHLPYMHRELLQQLVCLARHSCRMQTGLSRDCA